MTRLIDADKLYPDCTTKKGTLAISQNQIANAPTVGCLTKCVDCERVVKIKEEKPQGEWIPVKTRPLTEEEKEEYPECSFMYDCKMPEDEQEVLVSTKWGVRTDIYCKDVDGCYFEEYCDEDDVFAWMPFPKPYEED